MTRYRTTCPGRDFWSRAGKDGPAGFLRPFRMALVLFCFCCFAAGVSPASASAAGQVIDITPGAFLERGGATLALALKDEVRSGDLLFTDATGRLRILFSDDSSLSLGGNTRLQMREYTPGGGKPAFKAHLGQGFLRAITGKIVDMNPEGFALTTPQATVGIRGTIISLLVDSGKTTVWVENTLRKVYVNGVEVPPGHKLTVPGDPLRPEPISPQDRRSIGDALAFEGRRGVAAAAPEPGQLADVPDRETAGLLAGGDGLPDSVTSLAYEPLLTQNLDYYTDPTTVVPVLPPVTTGVVTGTLFGTTWVTTGDFSFNVDLASGVVSGATMYLLDASMGPGFEEGFDLSGGSGSIVGGVLSVSGFGGNAISGNAPFVGAIFPTTEMTGTADISAVGGAANGNYTVDVDNWGVVDTGAFSGNRTQ